MASPGAGSAVLRALAGPRTTIFKSGFCSTKRHPASSVTTSDTALSSGSSSTAAQANAAASSALSAFTLIESDPASGDTLLQGGDKAGPAPVAVDIERFLGDLRVSLMRPAFPISSRAFNPRAGEPDLVSKPQGDGRGVLQPRLEIVGIEGPDLAPVAGRALLLQPLALLASSGER